MCVQNKKTVICHLSSIEKKKSPTPTRRRRK